MPKPRLNVNCTSAMIGIVEQPRAEPIEEEDVHQAERDQADREAHGAGDHGAGGEDDLGELHLPDEPLAAGDRAGRRAERDREPLPRQDGGEDEQRVVRRAAVEDDLDEDDVDRHLEERVEDPPDLAEHGVDVRPLHVRRDHVADEPATAQQLHDSFGDEADRRASLRRDAHGRSERVRLGGRHVGAYGIRRHSNCHPRGAAVDLRAACPPRTVASPCP